MLVRNDEVASQGGGEPAIVPMGGVIANAVFDATGVRYYRLPMTPERVRAALAKAKEAAPGACVTGDGSRRLTRLASWCPDS